MAFKILLLVCLVAAANAGYVWVDDEDSTFSSFPHHQMPNYFVPRTPRVPHFGYFPFVPILPDIPTVHDIRNAKPGPHQVYSGVAVRSSSGFTKDKDGNLVKTGGSSLLVNNDGQVEEAAFGTNPPKIDDPIVFPSIKMPNFHHRMPHMAPMPPIPPIPPMPPIPPVDMHDYKPGKNEHFVGVSTSSFSHSSNINGVKSSGAGKDTVVNIDGAVDEEVVQFGQHDKD